MSSSVVRVCLTERLPVRRPISPVICVCLRLRSVTLWLIPGTAALKPKVLHLSQKSTVATVIYENVILKCRINMLSVGVIKPRERCLQAPDVCSVCSSFGAAGAEFHVVIPKISAFSFIQGRGGGAAPLPFLSRNLGWWEVQLFSFQPSWLLLAPMVAFVWSRNANKVLVVDEEPVASDTAAWKRPY